MAKKKTIKKTNRRKGNYRVALFVQDMGSYGEQAVQAIAHYAKTSGNWRVDMATFGEVSLQDVAARQVDGVIFGQWDPLAPLLAAIDAGGMPALDISGKGLTDVPPARVTPDDRRVGAVAAEHFIGRGFHHFSYYGLPEEFDTRWEIARREGYCAAVENRGYQCDWFRGTAKTWQELHDDAHLEALRKWLKRLRRPNAILCCTDAFCYEILRVARECGILVPDELAVCGVDNRLWICTLASPTITSIPLDGAQAGSRGAELLAGMMAGEAAPSKPVLIAPLEIVQRESTDFFAFQDSDVVATLQYIRDNAHRPFSVDDILDAVPVSRRSIEIRFKEATGQTLQTAIWRSHLEKATQLLWESRLPMLAVSRHAGFRSSAVFNVMFRKQHGITPTEFRRRAKRPIR